MTKIRLSEIATELGLSTKDILVKAEELGLIIRGHTSSISLENANALANYILSGDKKGYLESAELDVNRVNNIYIEINNTKNIKKLSWGFPYQSGIYAIIGENGCGKSTLITCLAKLVHQNVLRNEFPGKGYESSQIIYRLDTHQFKFEKNPSWSLVDTEKSLEKLDGFFESSVLNGSRFKRIDLFWRTTEIENSDEIIDAHPFIIENMNYILAGKNTGKFDNLKQVTMTRKRKKGDSGQFVDQTKSFYAIELESLYVKEFFLSTGEYFLLSILKFLSSILNKRNIKPSIIIIDEIEISLHPLAQKRLIEKLIEFKKTFNLLIIFATHSLHIIDNMNPNDIYYLEKDDHGERTFYSPIYPAYLYSRLYNNTTFDKVILVEDKLSTLFIKEMINNFNIERMIYTILPIGGWEKVLEIHDLHMRDNIFGKAQVVSILDGDIQDKLSKHHKKKKHFFLPISNIEYIVSTYLHEHNPGFLKLIDKEIAPKTFSALSIEIKIDTTTDRKNTYHKLISEMEKISGSEDIIVNRIIRYIMADINFQTNMEKFQKNLEEFFDIKPTVDEAVDEGKRDEISFKSIIAEKPLNHIFKRRGLVIVKRKEITSATN